MFRKLWFWSICVLVIAGVLSILFRNPDEVCYGLRAGFLILPDSQLAARIKETRSGFQGIIWWRKPNSRV